MKIHNSLNQIMTDSKTKKEKWFKEVQNGAMQAIESRHPPKQWEQFDDLEREQRHRGKLSDDEDDMSPQTQKKKRKPITKKEKKLQQIQEYQKALQRLRSSNTYQYYSPYDKHKLNIDKMPVLKMLENAFETQYGIEETLRRMGLKTVKILFKTGARSCIGLILNYLKQERVPNWIIERHRELMRAKDNTSFISDQNTLLRTMSHSRNTCLERD